MSDSAPLLLVDSNYLGHAAKWTTGHLVQDGSGTGIIWGILSRILVLAKRFETNRIVWCWDSRESLRRDIYPNYKISRRKKDRSVEEQAEMESAFVQFRKLRCKVLPTIGFRNNFHQHGVEGDDIIASICKEEILETIIIIGTDEDFFQLLSANISIYNPSKKAMMTESRFKDTYGILPRLWREVKAIAGCSTDDVKGIQGVGEKTAIKFIKQELAEDSSAARSIKLGYGVIQRNFPLVSLPFEGTKKFPIIEDCFDRDRFRKLCEYYRFESFLDERVWAEWIRLFTGKMDEDLKFSGMEPGDENITIKIGKGGSA